MEIGMLNFWLGLLVTALMKENYFTDLDYLLDIAIFSILSYQSDILYNF